MTRPRLAYVMSRFPHLPETFILREMSELDRQGWSVGLYPLILQKPAVVQPDAVAWTARAIRLPLLSASVVAANVRMLVSRPRRYLSTMAMALCGNLVSPKFFVRTVALLPRTVYAADLMRRAGVTHLHAHYATHPGLAAWVIHRLTGIAYSITVHAHDIFVDRAMLVPKLRSAAFIVAISEYNQRFLRHIAGDWTVAKVHVIRCGVREPRRRLVAPSRQADQRFEIISVGSLQDYKGFHVLIDALALLARDGMRFRCRIVGDGVERGALQQQIERLGLARAVELVGARTEPEVEQLLASAHCYVQSSVWTRRGKGEGLPVALMEALAASLPVVATAISGIPELVRDGQTGWLVPSDDAAAIAGAVQQIEADPEHASAVAARGRALVCAEYDLEANVTRLGELLVQSGSERVQSLATVGSLDRSL